MDQLFQYLFVVKFPSIANPLIPYIIFAASLL